MTASNYPSSFVLWPSRRLVSHDVVVMWASDAIANGDCPMNPAPTLTELQLSPKLAREVVSLAGYATFRAGLVRVTP